MDYIDRTNADLHQDGFIGGFYIRSMGLKKCGDIHEGHEHLIDHVTNIKKGHVLIEWTSKTANGTVLISTPCKILIRANANHKFIAMTDDVEWECWFSEAEAEKVYGGMVPVNWFEEKNDG